MKFKQNQNRSLSFDLVIGMDRSDLKIDLCERNADGSIREDQVANTPEVLHEWLQGLAAQAQAGKKIALAFEHPSRQLLQILACYHRFDLFNQSSHGQIISSR